jgi:hypothetical protein
MRVCPDCGVGWNAEANGVELWFRRVSQKYDRSNPRLAPVSTRSQRSRLRHSLNLPCPWINLVFLPQVHSILGVKCIDRVPRVIWRATHSSALKRTKFRLNFTRNSGFFSCPNVLEGARLRRCARDYLGTRDSLVGDRRSVTSKNRHKPIRGAGWLSSTTL